MKGLKHEAEEAADRIQNNDEFAFETLTRAEIKYAIFGGAENIGDGIQWDEDELREDVFDSEQSANVSFDELVALAEFVREIQAAANEE